MGLKSRQGGPPLIYYIRPTRTQPLGAAGTRHRGPLARPPLPDAHDAAEIRRSDIGLRLETGRSLSFGKWAGSLTVEICGGESFGPSCASRRESSIVAPRN